MNACRPLAPVIAALCVLAVTGSAGEPGPSCVVDVEAALEGEPKTTDVIPLAEGTWVGDVYVLPYSYPATYDRHLPGGIDNIQARQWVAQSFFAHNPDAYDFIAVVTGFPFDAGWGQLGDPTHALYWGIRNDTSGLGLPFFDHAQAFGSHRLQGYIDANSLELVRDVNGLLDEQDFVTILSHELGHRWLAYCDYRDNQGAISSALRGVDDGHWSYLLDTDASFMYGADWHDNGDGSFTATEIKARYSDLDLYLMGMLGEDEIEPFNLLVNAAVPPDQYPELGATIAATTTSVTTDDVIAAEGPRSPSAADAPHELRVALVYLAAPDAPVSTEDLDFLTTARDTWQRLFFAQTDGRGVIGVGRNSLVVASPPTLDLAAAVNWLLSAVDGAGLWQDDPRTRGRDSAAVIAALDVFGGHATEVAAALDALASCPAAATEIEAWRAEPLALHSHPEAPGLLDQLSSWVLDEGAWGGGLRYAGDTVTTARVARALTAGSRGADADRALSWIADRQNPDGGWSWRDGGPSAAAPTLEAVASAVTADPQRWSTPSVQDAVMWLLGHRTQGGFGDPRPDVAQTAIFLSAARGQGVSRDIINDAIAFLAMRQRTDGSWGGSTYQTAQAVAALAPYVQPDLAVSPSELLVEPESPFVEDQLTLVAAVRALNGDVPAGVGFRWEVIDAADNVVAILEGVLPPIPATLFATVTESWDLRHHVAPGPYTFRFTVDPLQQLAEADEGNNVADLPVVFQEHSQWIDLVLSPDAVHATPSFIGTLPQTVVIDGVVSNTAWMDAHNAVVAVFEVGSSTPMASTIVTVPLNGEAPFQLTIQLDEARPYQLAVVADPDGLLNDADPSDNRVDLEIGVAPVFDPAVVPGSLVVSPATGAQAGDLLTLEFEAVNRGTEPVSNLQVGVSFTAGDPTTTTPIRLLELTGDLGPGELRTLILDWRPPVADPDLTIAIEVDPSQLVNDANRGNNLAQISFAVAPSPLPNLVANHADITFAPEPALQHSTVQINTVVANPTDNAAGPFVVRLWIDEVGGGVLVGQTTVTGLAAGGTTTVATDWLVDEMADRVVWIDVDADGEVAEFNEDDNRDFRVLDVHTIPDLVMTSGQVSFDPRFPHTGDLVHLEVSVLNTGDQTANDVEVEIGEAGGAVIDSATIPVIAGGSAETVAFDWPTDGIIGDVTLRVTVDPWDSVAELAESNNTVDLAVAVQDADLWVTERYISPNGDGVRDQTTIFVRENVTTIDLIDPWGELVRRLDVDPSGQTMWDGRKGDGAAVRDGVYELRAGGLSSWVEVDLNGITITDDIRQPLITGNLTTSSSHRDAEFTSFTPSPIDGIVYLTERLGGLNSPSKMWRWSGERLEDVPNWPDGHWHIHQMSAHEDIFITQALTYSLIRFPGPQVDSLPAPAGVVDTPHLSPDGTWMVWTDSRASQDEKSVILQRTDDLTDFVEFGPYPVDSSWACPMQPTVHWAPGSTRAAVTLFGCSTVTSAIITLTEPPTVRVREFSVACRSHGTSTTSTTVDFDRSRFYCANDDRRILNILNLNDGTTVAEVPLPDVFQDRYVWYRISTDARAVEVDEWEIPQLKGEFSYDYFLWDWRRGYEAPWVNVGFAQPPVWSTHDRYVYSHIYYRPSIFTYRTPAANLAVTLDPVVRFGGGGIDLFLTVTDKNLDHYRLDFAPESDPDAFEPLGQPARGTIFGESWGTWIPPAQGAWRIRLTASDLAGNERSVARWVRWDGISDIAGLWTEGRHISPVASPGVQDALVWRYTVLRPAQLLFEIVDESDSLLRRIPVGASQTGPTTTTWDGLDDAGRPVPDGHYRLVFRGAEWPVTVDNTPPLLSFEIADNGIRPTVDEIAAAANRDPPIDLVRSALFNQTSWSAADQNLEAARFESRHVDQTEWAPVAGPAIFAGVTAPDSREAEVRAEWWAERIVRQVATDRAGNRSVAERLHREEQLAFAVAEPPCRTDDEPCLFPDRPDVNTLRDADGLMNDDVAVLWPDYSTLLVQSTVWGDWRDTLRLEFRVPADNGFPPGTWQTGPLTPADRPVWRSSKVLTGNPQLPIESLDAKVLPLYWEHPGLPLRPYEVRLIAMNRDGVEITTPSVLMVPKAPLAVEYLATDAGGDHFRVHNIGATRIDDIVLLGGQDTLTWRLAATVGSLDPGHSTMVSTGCGFLNSAIDGIFTNWVRVEGVDPWDAPQTSLPAPFQRAGPSLAVSRPNFSVIRGDCTAGPPAAMGLMGYNPGATGPEECTSWSCALGWHSTGNLVDLQLTLPDTDPNGTPIAGYELLIDGNAVAGAPDLAPGTTGRVILDLAGLAEGPHIVSERYLFAPGAQGMLTSCVQTAALNIDRSAAVAITQPTVGQSLCPDQGVVAIGMTFDETTWRRSFFIDGSTTGITTNPPSITVSALDPGPHLLEAEVVDLAGNAACASVEFLSEGVAAVTSMDIDPPVFSPTNALGRPTQTLISFGSTSSADWIAEIRDTFDDAVRTLSGNIAAGETIALSWDGRDFDGDLVQDGVYDLWIRLDSDCGAIYETPEPLPEITLDTEGPSVVVINPWPGMWLGAALELQALVTDSNLERWEARLTRPPPFPSDPVVIASGDRPSTDPNNVLARWPTGHLVPGDYLLIVEATDESGNQTTTDAIPLVVQDLQLIASYGATPVYFSPNGDGVTDTVDFAFELFLGAEVTLGFEGWIRLIDAVVLPPDVVHTATWDGLDPDQNPVPDGAYSFALYAYDPVFEEESDFATVIVDRTPPDVVISSPQDGTPTSLPVTVSGFTDDLHADNHAVVLHQPDGSQVELSSGPGDWPAGSPFTLSDLPDGDYTVIVTAADLARNTSSLEHAFVVDDTAPSVQITTPAAGEVLDAERQPFVLRGAIAAAHPQSYAWWIAEGASPAPADFVLIHDDALATAGVVEHLWTGPPPIDGTHTLRLTVLDQLGRSTEDRRIVTIDSNDPVVEIWSPSDGIVITEPAVITGSVDDGNLSHWSLEEIVSSGATRVLAAGTSPTDDQLVTWDPLPEDGLVTLRLSAYDDAGHWTEASVTVEVSVMPPGPPVDLTADVIDGRDVELSWQPGPGPAPVGYHMVRNGVRLTTSPIPQLAFIDSRLLDGAYTYEVIAVGSLGRESDPSAPATVVVDLTPPIVAITSPAYGSRVGSEIAIYGTAFAADDFAHWEVAARAIGAPGWIVLDTATNPVLGGFMTSWITHLAPWADGPHELRLAAEDTLGNRAERVIPVILDNTAPDPGPVNLQATLSALDADGLVNDVQLSWVQSPAPPDLAGFYLYRNGLLANAGGPVVGDPTPYLLAGTTHVDRDVADGIYTYGVVAADTAGNSSALSNPAGPITVDIRRPHAVIVSPIHLTLFEGSIEITVECEDEDVTALDLQYRLPPDPTWTPVAPTFAGPPYVAVFAPAENGSYQVRALASDANGPDPAPHIIQLTAADLPPSAPLQVTARVSGNEITLTWIAPPDPADDLAGYDVMRDDDAVNTQLLPPETLVYLDTDLTDRTYQYRVVAVDQSDHRGSSDPVHASVVTPFWPWIAPVTQDGSISLTGGGAHPLGSVEIRRFVPGEGLLTVAVIDADNTGAFQLSDIELIPGTNAFTAASTDGDGNTSRVSLPQLVVSHLPPEMPENLNALADGADVRLTWTAPPDPESAGFEIRRAGSVINETASPIFFDPSTHTLNASSGDAATWPHVVDDNPSTGWTPTRVPTPGTPEWWSWTWPDPVEIHEVIIGWSQASPPQVFDVDVLTGGGWLGLASLGWDGQPTMTVPAGITATGVRVRTPMTGPCGSSSCIPELTEVTAGRIDRTVDTTYLDTGLPDGVHSYEVFQHNLWGQTSWPASTAVSVGPVQPFPPTGLTVTPVDCGGLSLQWQPALSQPGTLTGYRLYRSDTPGGPYQWFATLGASQTGITDSGAPVGTERHYVVTSMVDMGGIAVESQLSDPALGTAECQNPPPPVITQPTVAGQPIQITPSQSPIWIRGYAVSGSTITLLHNGVPLESKSSSSVFYFYDVEVLPGSNSYVARQDIYGTVVDSAPITVELDPTLIPDLAAVSFTVTPEAAAPGDLVMAEGTVELLGTAGAAATFDVLIDVEDPTGARSDVYRTTLFLEAGERATIRTPWDPSGPTGLHQWRFTVDPNDGVLELDESNNIAIATSQVLAESGLELRATIDRPGYLVGQQLTGEVFFASSDPPEDILLETRLEDSGGRLVAVLDSRTLTSFGPSWLTAPLDHPLIGLYPGLYRVRAAAVIDGVAAVESLAPFQLEQPTFVEALVRTDRSSYPEGTPVAVTGRIHNLGPTPVDGLLATLSVIDVTTGHTVGHSLVPNIGVAAGGTADISWSWSSSNFPIGVYQATLVVNDLAGTTLAAAEPFPFTLVPGDLRLTAGIDLSASPVEPGDDLTALVTVTNTGSTDLPTVDIAVKLVDPIAMFIVAEHIHPVALAAGADDSFNQWFDTSSLALQPYVVLVTASGDDGRGPFVLDLSSATLEVDDLSPPSVLVIEPVGGGVACDAIYIAAEVEDVWSRIARVYHHLDDEPTAVPLHLEDPGNSPTLWSATQPLPPGVDGPHNVTVYAEDSAGNLNDGEFVAFDADTVPPILQITGPGAGSCLPGDTAFTFTAVDTHLAALTALLDGQPYTSGATISADGGHIFEVTAIDTCGRQAHEARSFVIDTIAPEIVVQGVGQGADVVLGTVVEWSISDVNLAATAATLDGTPVDSPLTLVTPGPHSLLVTATDCAANTTAVDIQFTVTESILSLTGSSTANPVLLEPGEPLTLGGTATNLGTSLDAVQLVLDVVRTDTSTVVATFAETVDLRPNQTHSMTAVADTTGWALGAYEIRFAARGDFQGQPFDLALGSATTRLADLTAPQLVLVGPPDGLACRDVEVTAEATDHLTGVSSVSVTVDAGAPVPLADTGGGTWSVALSLEDGPHHLEVVATDGADNTTPPSVVDIDLDTGAPELTVTAPGDGACSGESTTIEFTALDAHLGEVSATLNSAHISSPHVVDEDGVYQLIVTAVDACGLETGDERQFTVDRLDPELSVTGVGGDEIQPTGVVVEWAATDDNLVASSATLDGESVGPSFAVTTVGSHLLVLAAEDCAGNTAEQDLPFETVLPQDGLGGTVTVTPAQVEPPETILTSAGIANLTDAPYTAMVLRLEIVDPLTGDVVDGFETTADLQPRTDLDLDHVFATVGLHLGEYELDLTSAGSIYGSAFNTTLATVAFEVVDRTAPTVTLLAPGAGLVCESIQVLVTASDSASGVESVRVHIDGDPAGLPLAHVGDDVWTADLAIEEGEHHLNVMAVDVAGNASDPTTVEIDLDLSPPVLTVASPASGACLSDPTTITFSADDVNLEDLRALLDGMSINSGAVISDDGDHHLLVVAADACGHSDTHSSDFVIDATTPVITVSGVSDGAELPPPVEIHWVVDEPHLVEHSAEVDGQPVESGVVIESPGSHTLVVDAADCAGNHVRTEIGFTVTEDPMSALAPVPPALTAGDSVLLLDRSPAGGEELERWLADHAGRVTRTTDGCAFLAELRRGRHELVVLYAPTGAIPLSTHACTGASAIREFAAELSAGAYRRGGVLVLGEGMEGEGCLACLLAASGTAFHDHVAGRVEAEKTTSIVDPGGELTIFDLRPVEPDHSFPLLLAGAGGETNCDGLQAVTVEFPVGHPDRWTVSVQAATPHQALDGEAGELDEGGQLDASTHPWVDLTVRRTGQALVIDVRSAAGGALPDWLSLTAGVATVGSSPDPGSETSAWIPLHCGLATGTVFDQMAVAAVETIDHETGQTVAASARRYGRGEALVLPWDVLAPANAAALPVVEQALRFSRPDEPWRAVTGLPLPVSFGIHNGGTIARTIGIEAVVPLGQLLEVWGDPIGLDPVRWEFDVGAGETASGTVWLLPTAGVSTIEIPFTTSVGDGEIWTAVETGVVHIDIDETDRWTELRDLRAALTECAETTDDSAVRASLRDVLAALDRVAPAGDDQAAADDALHDLGRAFNAAEDEALPCLADLRARLADLMALWQARWVATGSTQ